MQWLTAGLVTLPSLAPQENDRLRSLRSNRIGKLSQFVGTVTRTTEVRGAAAAAAAAAASRGAGPCAAALIKARPRPRGAWASGCRAAATGSSSAAPASAAPCPPPPAGPSGALPGHVPMHAVHDGGQRRRAAVQVHTARHLPQRHLRQQVRSRPAPSRLGGRGPAAGCQGAQPWVQELRRRRAGGARRQTRARDISVHTCRPTVWATPPPRLAPVRRTAWTLVMDESVFVDWQKVKVQENPDEVRPAQGVGCRDSRQRGHGRPAELTPSGRPLLLLRAQAGEAAPRCRCWRSAPCFLSHLPRTCLPLPICPYPSAPQVPAGSLPRTMEVILRCDQARGGCARGLTSLQRAQRCRRGRGLLLARLLPARLHNARLAQPLAAAWRWGAAGAGGAAGAAGKPCRATAAAGRERAPRRQGRVQRPAGGGAGRGGAHVSGRVVVVGWSVWVGRVRWGGGDTEAASRSRRLAAGGEWWPRRRLRRLGADACARPPRSAPGERPQSRLSAANKSDAEGVTGLTQGPARTGVRELTYRLVFIACSTQARARGGGKGAWPRLCLLAPSRMLTFPHMRTPTCTHSHPPTHPHPRAPSGFGQEEWHDQHPRRGRPEP